RPRPARRSGQRLALIDKPERTQSQTLFGQPAPRWGDPEVLALQGGVTALGGTFTARVCHEGRSTGGLSYGASARLGHGRGQRGLSVHVFPALEQTPETLELVIQLFDEWAKEGLRDDEVEFARGHLGAAFAFNLATPEDRLDLAVSVA